MRLIVGISGASGSILGIRLLEALREIGGVESHLTITQGARRTIGHETSYRVEDVIKLADYYYDVEDVGALIASGSFVVDGMVVIPCSMKTLAGIVSGYTDNLLLRAADVCLKERRRLILVPRETPLNMVHIENMKRAAEAGCILVPPVLSFYNRPATILDMVDHIVGKVLMLVGISYHRFVPWKGERSGGD